MKSFTLAVLISTLILGSLAFPTTEDKKPLENRSYVVACSHLPNGDLKNAEGEITPMDSSDPFMVIRNKVGTQIYRSETLDNTHDPVFQFAINWDATEIYNFEFRDHDAFAPDDTLGQVNIGADGLEGIHNLGNPAGGTIQIIKLGA